MEHGIKTMGGDQIGKTIIFAQSQKHARFIVERFGALYPKLARGGFIKVVVHSEDYSHAIIQDFKRKTIPVITVSVDMMDTGVGRAGSRESRVLQKSSFAYQILADDRSWHTPM